MDEYDTDSALKIESAGSYEKFVNIYQATQRQFHTTFAMMCVKVTLCFVGKAFQERQDSDETLNRI
jgi:Ni,Fe-hydrogenase I cytochrome b subunit